jgi:hypothetical protein
VVCDHSTALQLELVDGSGRVLALGRDDLSCRTGVVKKAVAATDKMSQVRQAECAEAEVEETLLFIRVIGFPVLPILGVVEGWVQ